MRRVPSSISLIETPDRARIDFTAGLAIMSIDSYRRQNAREAKVIVALAFRNGPIEDIHAGDSCPTCSGRAGFSRITDEEMKAIMKSAVDHVYQLLVLRDESPEEYESKIRLGERYTVNWDEPRMPRARRQRASS